MRKLAEHQEEASDSEVKPVENNKLEEKNKTLEMSVGEVLGLIAWHNERIAELLRLLK